MLSRLIIAIAGIATMTIGTISVAGYVLGVPRLYGWLPDRTVMAFNTAIAFVVVGLALTLIGYSHRLWGTTR